MKTEAYRTAKKAYAQAMKQYMDLDDETPTGEAVRHLDQLLAAWRATW